MKFIRTNSSNNDFQKLVEALDADLKIRDGEDNVFYAQFNKITTIKHVIVAYDNSLPMGCGAIKKYADDTMEVKRMYVLPEKRGQGIAILILDELEAWAKELNYARCILETGQKQPEAIALYKKEGYQVMPNYGQYEGIANSICFKKILFNLLIFSLLTSCIAPKTMVNNHVYALRLRPNQDLKQEIVAFAKANNIQAGYIITCVGSLKKANLRLANQPEATTWEGKFEIVSLVGTFGADSGVHLHASISDGTGKTIGGHLMDGNLVYTTAEIIIGEVLDVKFSRKLDSITTYNELFIEKK